MILALGAAGTRYYCLDLQRVIWGLKTRGRTMTKRVKQDEAKLWCPGYGKCAIAAEGAGRPVKRGMCSWCKTHGGVRNRPPVRGYCRISRIIRIDSPAGQLQNP